ncbi:MAG TPA: 23S rRNA (guanosine(2251)-2'-O)-methyltransferase RlmB [Bacillota bacterium]|nr:23S rRNA (guanosine(2251)-2'-O)-methyltransferase RlmB [Bacillota bacterium]HPF42044.1 23S rRNA (guanosine(2251)-2'-O)-methyltransferase RlmB [Bacillota bacterium]HPJ86329.1 23S rRNA (guanosine(2251)-2'-O)-methyltransferase RlmB [Bacillota bacterium]HPQ62441.1 23S rRNA (guanosine(2251)-2'-O)-methyltransferase RlmB [Bacillota bacterium]HRX92305.1 23S rRNA (guanosine(2251)-2'-O)-methyltransferase RlmB [Candidatus Izemoplasmatales bacterium]
MSIYIYGKNPVQEILNSGKQIIQAFVMEKTNGDLLTQFQNRDIPTTFMDRKNFDSKFPGVNQGVAVEIKNYETVTIEEFLKKIDPKDNPLVLMLDGIQDPHNLGAIARSAEAGGVKGIIIPQDRSVGINATVVKASAGAIEYMDIITVTNLVNTAEKLKEAGFWIIGTAADATVSYTEAYVDRPVCLVIGSEGKGMHRLLREHSDLLVAIPMVGKINSLNASVGAAILIFDILRRKKG